MIHHLRIDTMHRIILSTKRHLNEADYMSDDEAEYYAVQKRRYLYQKAMDTFSDYDLTNSFENKKY